MSVFGYQMRFDLAEGFPLVTTKKVHFPSIAYELLWFLRGDGERALAAGARRHDLGRVGRRGRRPRPRLRRAVAQLADPGRRSRRPDRRGRAPAARGARLAPDRRQRLERRRPAADGARAVPRVLPVPRRARRRRSGPLSCQLYQRSADVFLGVPFNIASYALLTHLLAQQCDLEVGELIWTGGDCHVYDNHREQVETQLAPRALPVPDARPRAAGPPSIFDYAFEDFEVVGYVHHPAIRAPVAV